MVSLYIKRKKIETLCIECRVVSTHAVKILDHLNENWSGYRIMGLRNHIDFSETPCIIQTVVFVFVAINTKFLISFGSGSPRSKEQIPISSDLSFSRWYPHEIFITMESTSSWSTRRPISILSVLTFFLKILTLSNPVRWFCLIDWKNENKKWKKWLQRLDILYSWWRMKKI